jgi:hypothetical protein
MAMKTYFTLTALLGVALLAGCATGKNGAGLDRGGPPAATAAQGTLLVYSAYQANADFNARDPHRPEYSDYRILTSDGKLLQKVRNNSGTMLQGAVPVALAPGQYNVVARANGHGYATIPVLIGARQTTILHLEGGGFRPDESAFNPTNAVRSSAGRIVGWKVTSGW